MQESERFVCSCCCHHVGTIPPAFSLLSRPGPSTHALLARVCLVLPHILLRFVACVRATLIFLPDGRHHAHPPSITRARIRNSPLYCCTGCGETGGWRTSSWLAACRHAGRHTVHVQFLDYCTIRLPKRPLFIEPKQPKCNMRCHGAIPQLSSRIYRVCTERKPPR